jgi:hypothetical protein
MEDYILKGQIMIKEQEKPFFDKAVKSLRSSHFNLKVVGKPKLVLSNEKGVSNFLFIDIEYEDANTLFFLGRNIQFQLRNNFK